MRTSLICLSALTALALALAAGCSSRLSPEHAANLILASAADLPATTSSVDVTSMTATSNETQEATFLCSGELDGVEMPCAGKAAFRLGVWGWKLESATNREQLDALREHLLGRLRVEASNWLEACSRTTARLRNHHIGIMEENGLARKLSHHHYVLTDAGEAVLGTGSVKKVKHEGGELSVSNLFPGTIFPKTSKKVSSLGAPDVLLNEAETLLSMPVQFRLEAEVTGDYPDFLPAPKTIRSRGEANVLFERGPEHTWVLKLRDSAIECF